MRIRTLLSLTLALAVAPSCARAQDAAPPPVLQEVRRLWALPGARRVDGGFAVAAGEAIDGPVIVVGGPVRIAGTLRGALVALDADVALEGPARVEGDLLVLGGTLSEAPTVRVTGSRRVHPARLGARVQEGVLAFASPDTAEARWWRRRDKWQARGWGRLRLVSARTYNRVEGLPVYVGPSFGRDLGWGRLAVDAFAIWRSVEGFAYTPENIGHAVTAEVRLGSRRGVRFGARLFDVIDPVEGWQLDGEESGLAAAVLRRDFRDYYGAHGGSLSASLFRGRAFDATVAYSDQRWADVRQRNPWTLFRGDARWRDNPAMDNGTLHLLHGTLRYDTRTDVGRPPSGWYLLADYERGTGRITDYGVASAGTRLERADGRTAYDRLVLDVRRYNRLAPSTQLNLRLIGGGWLSGDDLPLQRRFSLGGPATLPGYDFRRTGRGPDVWQCGAPPAADAPIPIGAPAQCERFVLAQAELRRTIPLDALGLLRAGRARRRGGWGRDPEWVVFADAGRGWLVDGGLDGVSLTGRRLPALSTLRADAGVGLVLDNLGVYVAKSITDPRAPANVVIRLRPRF